jgi:hypothetical protein
MRFLCFNFLMATIGPTVRRISAAEVALTDDDLFRVTHECWDSIYSESFALAVRSTLIPAHRHLFPMYANQCTTGGSGLMRSPLRKVFASLRAFLRKKQPEETA